MQAAEGHQHVPNGIERAAQIAWLYVEKHDRVIAIVLSASYFLLAILAARAKMLWGDELYTLYVARLRDWGQINHLLATGGEFHPPFFYLMESACMSLFGETELALRLPAIGGFWLMLICLFLYLRRCASVTASLAGAIFPALTACCYFATEARGYALVLGFASLALLCWDRSGLPHRRVLMIAGFALSLAAAAASSYYGILLAIPFAIAQGLRSRRTRKLEPTVWLALGVVTLPMILSGALVRTGMHAVSPWPAPPWSAAIGFYADLLQPATIPLVCFIVIVAVRRLALPQFESPSPRNPAAREHLALAVTFLTFSLWVMLTALLATHAFALRYAVPSVIGVSLLVGFAASRATRFEQVALLTIFAGYAIAGIGLHTIERNRRERAQWDSGVRWLAAREDRWPLVVDGVGAFLKLSRYSSPEIRSRMAMIVDPAKARRYGVDDSGDHTLTLLNPWFRLPVAGYDDYGHSQDEFLVLSDHWPGWAGWQWLTRALVDDGWSVSLVDQHAEWLLYKVKRPHDAGDR